MKIGVQLPEVERRVAWPEYRAMAEAAETGGLDSLWVGDHLLYDLPDGSKRGPWECWSLLAGLAAVTESVTLAPLVASTSFHAPAMLAKKAVTVDEISGGRLMVGLGAGWNQREYTAFGFPFDHRVSRFEEAFTIIRTLLRDGQADFTGQHYEVSDCVLDPPARPDLPLMIGSSGPRMLEITMPYVDAWNIWYADYDNDPANLGEKIAVVDDAARAAGRRTEDITKTAALLVNLEGEPTRRDSRNPIVGANAMTVALDGLEQAGVDHVQLVLDPITITTVELASTSTKLLD